MSTTIINYNIQHPHVEYIAKHKKNILNFKYYFIISYKLNFWCKFKITIIKSIKQFHFKKKHLKSTKKNKL